MAFGLAAARGKAAGYDLVEIHCAHGYLLSQFLSPLTNQRQDQFGGTLDNRMRFLLETITAVRSSVGFAYPLMVRLGISDIHPNMTLHSDGLTLEEGIQVAQAVEKAGCDILDISGGLCGSRPAGLTGEAYFLPWLQALRPSVHVPLLITGGISRSETAAAIIANGDADLVGVGRSLVADPKWISKAKAAIHL
jgi:2,4-dienoyl-CoA reductase-like NADH-dependent reductase (Old Yellow Enzyme family)